jgi:hypothetical protein
VETWCILETDALRWERDVKGEEKMGEGKEEGE